MKHRCHVPACRAPCPPRHLTCRKCWALVPPALQAAVYDTVGKRTPGKPDKTWAPWWRAQALAINAVLLAGVFRCRWTEAKPGAFAALLARELLFADYLEGVIDAAEHERQREAMREAP